MRILCILTAGMSLWLSSAVGQTAAGSAVASAISSGGSVASASGSFAGAFSIAALSNKGVTGKPLSATGELRTVRIQPDGTRTENTETVKLYRDDAGRIRIEKQDGSGMIQEAGQDAPDLVGPNGQVRHNLPARYDGPLPEGAVPVSPAPVQEEDLGSEVVNGVTAQRLRTTTTNGSIQIVGERWYSKELEIDVKTVTSDPRSRETTCELKDIQAGAQDPRVFVHPHPMSPPAGK